MRADASRGRKHSHSQDDNGCERNCKSDDVKWMSEKKNEIKLKVDAHTDATLLSPI